MEGERRSFDSYRIARISVITIVLFLLLFVGSAQIASADSETVSGTCGDDLTWVLDDQGTLTIRGTGDMQSFGYHGAPWYDKRSDIKKVVLEDGVTNIAESAFQDCSKLATVTIPDSVTCIEYNAFTNCVGLTEVVIPDSVELILGSAFYGCIGLTAVQVDPDNACYRSENGIVYSKDGKTIVHYPAGVSAKEFTIPDGVTDIGDYAFQGSINLTGITIPDSVKKIGIVAFGSSGITSMSIPEGVTWIGLRAFDSCTSLTTVEIPDSVTHLDYGVFMFCSGLTDIRVGSGNTAYKAEDGVLFSKDGTTLIRYPAACPETEYSVPNGVTVIGGFAFEGSSNLTGINLPDSVTTIESQALANCRNLTSLSLPDGLKSLGSYALVNCRSLKSIVVPEGITEINSGVFQQCTSLEKVILPSGITRIGGLSFWWCPSLTDINIPDSVKVIEDAAFSACSSLEEIILPDGLESIEEYAFNGCNNLKRLTIPDSVTAIGPSAFPGSCVLIVEKDSAGYEYAVEKGIRFETEHEWTTEYTIDKEPTCTEAGIRSTHCIGCGMVKEGSEEAIPPIDHKWNSTYTIDIEATYAAEGSKSIHCSVCDAKKPGSVVSIPKLTVKATTITKVKAVKKGFTVKWKTGTEINGYEIQYALNKKFTKGKKIVKIAKPGKLSQKVTKLKAKKKYWVRIRTYKTVDGNKYYSKWSKAKTVTTKK